MNAFEVGALIVIGIVSISAIVYLTILDKKK